MFICFLQHGLGSLIYVPLCYFSDHASDIFRSWTNIWQDKLPFIGEHSGRGIVSDNILNYSTHNYYAFFG